MPVKARMRAKTNARAAYLGPERRRPLVLGAAMEAFAERGFLATSMNDVAGRAAVSKAVLYDCYPGGKDELFAACVREASERLGETRAQWTAAMVAGVSPGDLIAILADAAAADRSSFAMLTSPRTGDTATPLVSILASDLRRAGMRLAGANARRLRLRIACLVALAKELAGADAADVAAIAYGDMPFAGASPREEPAWSEAVAG